MGAIHDLSRPYAADMAGAVRIDSESAQPAPLGGVFLALLAFMIVYCARPEDWIPGLSAIPLAKITVMLALLGLAASLRHIHGLPREVYLLALLIGQMFAASALSPVWRSWAFLTTINFAKVLIIVIVISAAVTTSRRLRLLILTQAASVSAIAAVAIWKGQLLLGRLEGVLGGNYSDPNDLALALAISLPLCMALMFLARSWLWKSLLAASMLVTTCGILLTGSRTGFLALLMSVTVCLWQYAIRGRRRYLLVVTLVAGVVLWVSFSAMIVGRLRGTFDRENDTAAAYGSAQQRQQLLWRSLEVTAEHPLFGVGPGDFDIVSGYWHTTHNGFTLMSSEAGLPAFIVYSLILCCGFRNINAAKRLISSNSELGVLARGLHGSLAAYVVGAMFLSNAYEFFPYILVAYTTALASIARASAEQIQTN